MVPPMTPAHPEGARTGVSFAHVLAGAVILWVVYGCLGLVFRPPFPVDETRYLTVAWEMYLSGDWVLPTLNFEPYHHKPPMLFWLINLFWDVFGVSRFAAGLVPVFVCALCLAATGLFARRLWPHDPVRDRIGAFAVLLMAGGLPMLVYGSLMMFDHLVTLFVIAALACVWGYYRTARWAWIGGFALAAGLGLLTKGPVMLLYVAFPVLLAPWWGGDWRARGYGWGRWYAAFLGLGLGGAVAVGLAWALPAALRGGPAYRDMILWGQTAGRLVQAFDHDRPLWWYLYFLPLIVLPWGVWPAFRRAVDLGGLWQGVRAGRTGAAGGFLGCWVVPTFICFCLISGKQAHYLIPLTPALWIAGGYALAHAQGGIRLASAARIALVFGGVILAAQAVGAAGLFRQFDLVPVADVLEREGRRPLAWARNYQGELGFVAHMTEPLDPVEHEDLPDWFADHPDGVAVVRYRRAEQIAPYTVLYSTPEGYRRKYAVVRPAGATRTDDSDQDP